MTVSPPVRDLRGSLHFKVSVGGLGSVLRFSLRGLGPLLQWIPTRALSCPCRGRLPPSPLSPVLCRQVHCVWHVSRGLRTDVPLQQPECSQGTRLPAGGGSFPFPPLPLSTSDFLSARRVPWERLETMAKSTGGLVLSGTGRGMPLSPWSVILTGSGRGVRRAVFLLGPEG